MLSSYPQVAIGNDKKAVYYGMGLKPKREFGNRSQA